MTPDLPSDPVTRVVTLPDGPVSYTDEGAGAPLLALHGLPGAARDWRWLGPAVAPGLRFLRVNLPGFGETPLGTLRDPGFEARADLVLRFADALGLERFAVIAHSIGGPAAMALAARAPDGVTALALVAAVGLRPHRGYRKAQAMRWIAPVLRVPGGARLLRPLLRRSFERFGFRGHGDEALVQTVAIVRRLDFAANRAHAAAVRARTLVAWAEDDALIEAAISEELAASLPAGPRLPFASGGHNLQKSRAVELAQALVPFVTGA